MRISKVVGLAVGALACGTALAQTTVNVPPAPGPIPLPGTTGGAILSVWNDNQSLTQYLNLQIADLQPAALTPAAGLVLNFQNVDLSAFGGSADLRYSVLAGDYNGGDPSQWQVVFTGDLDQAPVGGSNGDGMANSLNNLTNFANFTNVACGATVPCLATNSQDHFAGNFANTLGNNLPFNAAGAVGSALSFWSLTSTSDLGGDDATLRRYQATGGTEFGRWLLTAAGEFSYAFGSVAPPVPLPAAVWLLLSGLGGLGVIARRRQEA